MSFSAEFWPALLVKGSDALAEIVGAAQPAVALAFELDCQRQAGILDVVHQLFRAALRQWRKAAQLFGQPIARRFKFGLFVAVAAAPNRGEACERGADQLAAVAGRDRQMHRPRRM